VLPASLPYIFTEVRLTSGISLIVIVAAEMVGATVGMGYMTLEAQQTFRTERVFAGILIIRVIGFTTDLGFRRLRRWLLPWHREADYT
jgi:ABC-type nitrate/sulfonate/bicarbonate transport system permease component